MSFSITSPSSDISALAQGFARLSLSGTPPRSVDDLLISHDRVNKQRILELGNMVRVLRENNDTVRIGTIELQLREILKSHIIALNGSEKRAVDEILKIIAAARFSHHPTLQTQLKDSKHFSGLHTQSAVEEYLAEYDIDSPAWILWQKAVHRAHCNSPLYTLVVSSIRGQQGVVHIEINPKFTQEFGNTLAQFYDLYESEDCVSEDFKRYQDTTQHIAKRIVQMFGHAESFYYDSATIIAALERAPTEVVISQNLEDHNAFTLSFVLDMEPVDVPFSVIEEDRVYFVAIPRNPLPQDDEAQKNGDVKEDDSEDSPGEVQYLAFDEHFLPRLKAVIAATHVVEETPTAEAANDPVVNPRLKSTLERYRKEHIDAATCLRRTKAVLQKTENLTSHDLQFAGVLLDEVLHGMTGTCEEVLVRHPFTQTHYKKELLAKAPSGTWTLWQDEKDKKLKLRIKTNHDIAERPIPESVLYFHTFYPLADCLEKYAE